MIPRVSMLTLGVGDLEKATAFYCAVFGMEPHPRYAHEVAFFALPGVWVALYPLASLAQDISPGLPPARDGFSAAITLAYNAGSADEVDSLFAAVRAAGAHIIKPPQDTLWGGYGGYFADLDGHVWEIAWGPMFSTGEDGSLRLVD